MAAVLIGAAAGGTIISLALYALSGADRASAGYVNALFLAGFAGLAAAALVAWTLARTMSNVFRRAMVAMVALGGAAFVGALTMIAHTAAGPAGLLALAALCILVIAVAYRAVLAQR